MPGPEHQADKYDRVACAVITVSDTRTAASDKSGTLIRERLETAGHMVVSHEIIPDEPHLVRDRVIAMRDEGAIQAIILTGGTGLAARDSTIEAVSTLLEKSIDGFGELFRMLSYAEIGPAAMLSRAEGGVCGKTLVFSIPGSTGAVRLAMDKLILPELGHMASLVSGT